MENFITSFGNNVNFLGPLRNISIGKNTTINSLANFRFKNAKINIGDDCLIARNVTILTQSYDIDCKEEISLDKMIMKNVDIGNNVLLGSNVIIMPGVSIGNNSVVGAGSVVTKNIGDLEV
jgi:acetyltransferase-like isoleucine patch superfamily enzyme